MVHAQAGFMVDWGGNAATFGMQDPAGHRDTIMRGSYREVGIGMLTELDPATQVGPDLVTQDFGSRGEAGSLLGGVAYGDADRNDFYGMGEGRVGLIVQAEDEGASSGDAGGWTLGTALSGLQTLTLSGAGLSGTMGVRMLLGDGVNAKLDVVDGTKLRVSASAAVSGAVSVVQGLGLSGLVLSSLDDAGRTYLGTPGADTITGGAGDDILVSNGGGDVLDGGGGRDVARLGHFVLGQASVSTDAATPTLVAAGPSGTVQTASVERAEFADGRVVFDASAPVAAVTRLYDAAFGRASDALGLHSWTAALHAGTPLRFIAEAFAASSEYASRFPAADNAAFVEQLYRNTLHRPSDADGKANWLGTLAEGATRGEVLAAFSESAEHQRNTVATVDAGLWDADVTAAQVARLYDTALGRRPDAAGLAGWTTQIRDGASLEAVAGAFAGSVEFRATYGALGDAAFVERLYGNTLHRGSDPAGHAFWTAGLSSGQASRAGVVVGFSESAEHQALTADAILGGTAGRMGVLVT